MRSIVFSLLLPILLLTACKSSQPAIDDGRDDPTRTPAEPLPSFPFPGSGPAGNIDELYVDACTFMMRGDLSSAKEQFGQVLELQPENHAARYNLARIALEEREYRAAIELANLAVKADPGNSWYRRLLVQAYERQGNLRKAEEEQKILLSQDQSRPDDWYRLAEYQHRLGKQDAAIATLESWLRERGPDPRALQQLFEWKGEAGDWAGALPLVEKLLTIDPLDERYGFWKYQALTNLRDWEAAEAFLQQWEQQGNGNAQMLLADFYRKRGNDAAADRYLRLGFENPEVNPALKAGVIEDRLADLGNDDPLTRELIEILGATHPGSAEADAFQAQLFLNAAQPDSARYYLQEAVAANPAAFDDWIRLLSLSFESGQYDHLYEDANDARELFPNQEEILWFYGLAAGHQGNYRQATRAFEKIILIEPEDERLLARTLAESARLLWLQQDPAEADKRLSEALDLAGSDAFVQGREAWLLAAKGQANNETVRKLQRSFGEAPTPAQQALLGFILWKNGQTNEALPLVQAAAEQAAVAEWWWYLGGIYRSLNQRDAARAAFGRARELGLDLDLQQEMDQP